LSNKVYTLEDAISKFVEDGDHISFGGFTTNRKPYAAVHEILRQGKKDFVVEAGPAGGDWDMLIGEGRVKVYNNCYTANSGVTNVSRRFRKSIENGTLIYEDYSQDAMMLMLHAASLGLPYLPVNLMMGSDLTDKWAISKEKRAELDKVPNDKFVYVENPFVPGQKVVALPVPKLDTAVIHVQQASPDGTARIFGDEFHDIDIAVAAKKTIVTCEELLSNEEIRREPTKNSIPCFCVDAVVHVPFGAHPSQCYDYYDYDNPYFKEYDVASKTDEGFAEFLNKYVYGVKNHEEYLNLIGAARLAKLKPTPGFGYKADISKEDM
jgi:glutaconate CoA-transferase subunit A